MKFADEQKFLELIGKTYDLDDCAKIIKAFNMAESLHCGQFRQSGEPYIIHPINVAYSLAEMHADSDTVCAGLLHDVLEDTNMTKIGLTIEFNEDIAKLVDGVTKISKMNFSTKKEERIANTSKIINGFTEDIRIIIIKLADRLHNMRTLEYKSSLKQKENSLETLEIFVPLANHIGAFRIQSELEDLALSYLMPEQFKMLKECKNGIEQENKQHIEKMSEDISAILTENNINNEIKIRSKNIFSIFRRFQKNGIDLSDLKKINNNFRTIHDLLVLRVMVDDEKDCYQSIYHIHSKYRPLNGKFKDFIYSPKYNHYKSLHTTVFGENERLVQAQVRTFEMDEIASFGLTAYWNIYKGNARVEMQKELQEKNYAYKNLQEISSVFGESQEFIDTVKKEVFAFNLVSVYTPTGEIIQLPLGAVPIDYAYAISDELGDSYFKAIVNDKKVSHDYKLKSNDRVKIIPVDYEIGPRENYEDFATTTNAKNKIKTFFKRHM